MTDYQNLAGVYAAAVTPLADDFSLLLDDVPSWLKFLAGRGCHGVLLLGTTGEGTSFAPAERISLLRAGLNVRQEQPDLRILVGTGTPSLEETIYLTRVAFDLGADGVVTLPPYYYRQVSDEGLFTWFSEVLKRAVPSGGAFLGYNIPHMSGIPFSIDLLARLRDSFPNRFAGIKDSSGDPDFACQLGARFGRDLLVLTGNDKLFTLALDNAAGGCITALANVGSPDHRRVWDASQRGEKDAQAQAHLMDARQILDRYPPAPAAFKAILAQRYDRPRWAVRPPLEHLLPEVEERLLSELPAETNSSQA